MALRGVAHRIVVPTLAAIAISLAGSSHVHAQTVPGVSWRAPHAGNPILPGYFADPSILQLPNETMIFATEDPWGGEDLGCWSSHDFTHWTLCNLNWPRKSLAISPTANKNNVWAPSVVKAPNGRYYMYTSIGSEVWVGVADDPHGPWKNALGDKPLIPATFNRNYNMIDAEAFIDTDGTAYLYWGSGLHWVNGHCFAVRLKPDMVTFDGEPQDVTPPNYFEGPFMYKRNGTYYLMYSEGKATNGTYKVRYSTGKTPFGPFTEGKNSPILSSDPEHGIVGPGHHAVFNRNGHTYILYHRHSLPFDESIVRRQVSVDELHFDAEGNIDHVLPTNTGPSLIHPGKRVAGSLPMQLTASSVLDELHQAASAGDDNYATRWIPAANDDTPWLQADLGHSVTTKRVEVRFEYPEKLYEFGIQISQDGTHWKDEPTTLTRHIGSPITFDHLPRCRYIRLRFPSASQQATSVFELTVY